MWIDKDGNPSPGWIIMEVTFIDEDGHEEKRLMRIFNPTDEQYREAGWTWQDPPTPVPDPSYERYRQEFLAACGQFRAVCAQIQQAAGFETFKGGFDEMVEYQQSEVYNTFPGVQLAIAWNAANELCTYLGSKIGLGQPEWWYDCWQQVEPEPTPEPEPEDPGDEPVLEEEPSIEEPAEQVEPASES